MKWIYKLKASLMLCNNAFYWDIKASAVIILSIVAAISVTAPTVLLNNTM